MEKIGKTFKRGLDSLELALLYDQEIIKWKIDGMEKADISWFNIDVWFKWWE